MRLVIDSNILVSELLRKRGRDLIQLSEIESKIMTIPLSFYQFWEIEARKRIPRDPIVN